MSLRCMLLWRYSNNAWSLESLALVRPSGAAAPAVSSTQLEAACNLSPGRYVLPEVSPPKATQSCHTSES
jgi:hypothetical protein